MKKIILIITLIIIVAIAPIIIIHNKNTKSEIKKESNSNEISSNSNIDSNTNVDSNSNISNENSNIISNSNTTSNKNSNSNNNKNVNNPNTKSNSNVTKKSNSNSNKNTNKLNLRNFNVNLDNVDNLMIVAHPDDEMIFGGSHLIDDNYLVVCVTCGVVEKRVLEFQTVMSITKDKYIMLSYPDKTNGKRDNWDSVRDKITIDLQKIMNMKKWKNIVTHNEAGEYGHEHHRMTHTIVTNIFEKEHKEDDNLYFFNTYYTKEEITQVEDKFEKISDENYEKKKQIIDKYYPSQYKVFSQHGHMYRYENFEKNK